MLRSRLQLALAVGLVVAVAAATGLLLGNLRNDATSAVAVSKQQQGPFHGSMLPEGIAGMRAHAFRLTDPRLGRELGTADVAGKPYAVTFLYTQCPDVCPLIGQELRQTLELLGPRADDVVVLAVSADPKGDTPARVRAARLGRLLRGPPAGGQRAQRPLGQRLADRRPGTDQIEVLGRRPLRAQGPGAGLPVPAQRAVRGLAA